MSNDLIPIALIAVVMSVAGVLFFDEHLLHHVIAENSLTIVPFFDGSDFHFYEGTVLNSYDAQYLIQETWFEPNYYYLIKTAIIAALTTVLVSLFMLSIGFNIWTMLGTAFISSNAFNAFYLFTREISFSLETTILVGIFHFLASLVPVVAIYFYLKFTK